MKRRQFIAGLGSAAAWPLAARAQQVNRMRRVGVLMARDEDDLEGKTRLAAFRQSLGEPVTPSRAGGLKGNRHRRL
jgi:putative tryptophan/tyrosine transport system substrate-binding protein